MGADIEARSVVDPPARGTICTPPDPVQYALVESMARRPAPYDPTGLTENDDDSRMAGQTPSAHAPPLQLWPHAPQFAESVVGSMHEPLQVSIGEVHPVEKSEGASNEPASLPPPELEPLSGTAHT